VSLTGKPVLVLSGLLTLVAPVVAVLLWDRVRGSRWRQVLARLGLLGAGEVLALVFAFIALNDYAGFVDSWSQVRHFVTGAFSHHHSGDVGSPDVSASADAAGTDFKLRTQQAIGTDNTIWNILGNSPPDKWVEVGVTQAARLTVGDLNEKTYVYLPPQYFGPAGRRDLPILELFTSFPGPTDDLISKLHVPDEVLAGIRAGEVSPMAVVMLRPDVTGRWNTACTDVPNGPQALTYYTKGLPEEVRKRFGLRPAPLLSLGYAAGGYCAAKLSMFDPAEFPAAAALSAPFHPPTDPSTRGVFADQTLRQQNDLGWRLQNLPQPNIALLLASGGDDKRPDAGRAAAAQWAGLVHAPMTVEQLVLAQAGHDFASYALQLRFDLSWLSARLPDARVRPASVPAGASTVGGGAGGRPQALAARPVRSAPPGGR